MDDIFLINLDRLKKKQNLSLNMEAPTDFLSAEECEVQFGPKLQIQGEAYIVDHRLVFHLDLQVPVSLACNICSEETSKMIEVNSVYHIEEIKNLKSPIFDFSSVLRQEILLEVPRFIECRDGNCPERETLKSFLGSNPSS